MDESLAASVGDAGDPGGGKEKNKRKIKAYMLTSVDALASSVTGCRRVVIVGKAGAEDGHCCRPSEGRGWEWASLSILGLWIAAAGLSLSSMPGLLAVAGLLIVVIAGVILQKVHWQWE